MKIREIRFAPLSADCASHWGLLQSPFASSAPLYQPASVNEFYHSLPSHKLATSNLENFLASRITHQDATRVVSIDGDAGSGLTTWMRQIAACSGLGEIAIAPTPIVSRNESATGLMDRIAEQSDASSQSGVRELWVIQTDQSMIAPTVDRYLRSHFTESEVPLAIIHHAHRMGNARYPVSVKSRAASAHSSGWQSTQITIDPPEAEDLRCLLGNAMNFAGVNQPIFSQAAMERIALLSGRHCGRLACLTHFILDQAFQNGFKRITVAVIHACLSSILDIRHVPLTTTAAKSSPLRRAA